MSAEQAEQEPVAWVLPDDLRILKSGNCGEMVVYGYKRNKLADDPNEASISLYAAPVRTKDLTDDDLEKIYDEICRNADSSERLLFRYARAVIAADREKNK